MAKISKERKRGYDKKYQSTKKGRASNLLCSYRQNDKKYNRGECTLTADWVIENIFSQPCAHCGETDWHKIGCNRLDNSKPHTPDNVEPCCKKCNDKLARDEFSDILKKQVYQYSLDGELIAVWPSAREAAINTGSNQGRLSEVCRGGCYRNGKWESAKTHNGYIWSYEPL